MLPNYQKICHSLRRETGFAAELVCTAMWQNSLPVVQFRLENGLNVVYAQDFRASLFVYQTWFGVGSKHEDLSATGLAHFFEHLMFKGTQQFASGVFDREMEQRGAQTNAGTWVDWTYYTEALASDGDNFATCLMFEADRMHNLRFDAQTFASELDVVKNERRMSVDDSIGGEMTEVLHELAFGEHPYSHITIGIMAHLQQMTMPLAEAFYRRYYVPNNATVILAGALDIAETLPQLLRAYGPLAAGNLPIYTPMPAPTLQAPIYRILHREVVAAQYVVGFKVVPQTHRDFAALEMLGEVLTGGESGLCTERLVRQEQVATGVHCCLHPFAEPGLFEIHVTLNDPAHLKRSLHSLRQIIEQLDHAYLAAELPKARNSLLLQFYESMRDTESMAETLGHFAVTTGDFKVAFNLPQRWQATDAQTLQVVAQRYLSLSRCCLVVVLPKHCPAPNLTDWLQA